MPSEASWTILARLIRPQGRKGELLAELFTDFPERFAGREALFLLPPGFTGEITSAQRVEVTSSWLPVGKNRGRIVLHLAGINTISEAEAYAGFEIAVPDNRRMPLESESIYVSDLVGCTLFDREVEVGKITGVQFPVSSEGTRIPDAPALLVVQSRMDEEILVPFAKAFVQTVDLPAKRLVMRLPAGLVEMNQS